MAIDKHLIQRINEKIDLANQLIQEANDLAIDNGIEFEYEFTARKLTGAGRQEWNSSACYGENEQYVEDSEWDSSSSCW
jgi:hypothetical protein